MTQVDDRVRPDRPPPVRRLAVGVAVLISIVLVSAVTRAQTDWPHILAGTTPEDDFAQRYVAHPWVGYLHIAPGVVYLLGAPLQLSRRFRTRHYTVHRRLGRVLVSCALLSGSMALAFGIPHAWGGGLESLATVAFGTWFLTCLVLAFRAIRRDDPRHHRRWMIRAFAVGVGIGTIRIWVGLFTSIQIGTSGGDEGLTLPNQSLFGLAFWIAFATHVAIGEWWLRRAPDLNG